MNKRRQSAYLFLGMGIVLVLLAVFFCLVYVNRQTKQEKVVPARVTKSQSHHQANDFTDLSMRQIVSLAIIYAQEKNFDNENWDDVYNQAKNGSLSVERYNDYHFDNGREVEADSSQRLYILNSEAALVVTNADQAQNSALIFGDDNEQIGGAINLKSAYQFIKNQGKIADWRVLSKRISVNDQVQTQSE